MFRCSAHLIGAERRSAAGRAPGLRGQSLPNGRGPHPKSADVFSISRMSFSPVAMVHSTLGDDACENIALLPAIEREARTIQQNNQGRMHPSRRAPMIRGTDLRAVNR